MNKVEMQDQIDQALFFLQYQAVDFCEDATINRAIHLRDLQIKLKALNEASPTCKGKNCTAVKGAGHSSECIKEHEDTINGVFHG